MILRQRSPSRKPGQSAPMPPRMLRPSALQLSRKLGPLAPTLSGKPKPFALQPSGMQRSGEPPRLAQSNGCMPRPSNTWRNKSSKMKLSQIDFLSAGQAAIQASPVELQGALVASYHILMGQAPMSHSFTLSQQASPTEQPSAPVTPSSPVPEHSPRPKWWHLSPDPVDNMSLGGTTSKATPEGPPSSKWWEIPPLYKVLSWSHSEAFSQDTSLVRETWEEYFKRHSPTSLQRTHMTCQNSSGVWPRMLNYLAWPFTKSRRYGRGQMSCNKLTTHWGPCQKAWNYSEQYPNQSLQRLWDWWAYMTWMHYATSMAQPTAPGVGRRARMRGQSSTTFGWCTIGLA